MTSSPPETTADLPPHAGRLSREWREALATIAAVFVATRIVIVALAICVEFVLPATQPAIEGRETASSRPVITSLTTWDAVYYLGIARDGYHTEPIRDQFHDWVFFPAYPAVVRVASRADPWRRGTCRHPRRECRLRTGA